MAINNPDKIIFVGEALVGNEAVDQLTKFDRAMRDFTASSAGAGKERGIDGMLVTKWDTVDDRVCILFVCFLCSTSTGYRVGVGLFFLRPLVPGSSDPQESDDTARSKTPIAISVEGVRCQILNPRPSEFKSIPASR